MRTSALRALPVVVPVLACAAAAGAQAENWFTSGDACMDLDSVHLVNDAKVDGTIVAYQVSACENDHPDKRTFLIGVRRDECPAILNGATSFGSYMREPAWPNWRKVALSDESFRGLAFTACRRKGSPGGLVVFDNDLSKGDVTIYVDGTQVCQLDSAYESPFAHSECDVDLRRFGTDSQFRHAVRIVAARGDVNDTVSISDCHWNWQGTKQFDIMDAKVHFDCM